MKPEWVQNIYGLQVGGDVIGTIIMSSFYRYATWGIPPYIHNKFLKADQTSVEL